MAYAFEHQGTAFTPDGTIDVPGVADHNREVERNELEIWATKPDHWQVYVTKKDTVSTWLGTVLGTIVRRTSFRTNLSRNIEAVRIRGTNGATYYGRFGADWSQLCHIRKCK